MLKVKTIITVIVLLVMIGVTSYYLNVSNVKPVSHAAMKVQLNQSQNYSLSLKSISAENSYASDYKLEKPYGFYLVKIFDKRNRELFSGKVDKNSIVFPPYQVGGEEKSDESSNLFFEPLKEISLLLPYYKKAAKIIIYDESGYEKLRLDAENIELPPDYSSNFCGNGICDSNENFFLCYNDCRSR